MTKEDQLLKDFIKECEAGLNGSLLTVALFGSRAKQGYAKSYSDYDFLVVAKKLPSGRERDLLAIELKDKVESKYFIPVQAHLVTYEELRREPIYSLIYGVLTGYKVLYGRDTWDELLSYWTPIIKRNKPELIDEVRTWQIAEMI